MAPEQTTRELIERLVWLNPKITVAEIAKRAKVSRQRVHQILDALGYELHHEWRRKQKKG